MEKIRLQKYMSDAGVMSRRAAEKEIEEGTITVNGEPAELGQKVDPDRDEIRYNGHRVYLPDNREKKTYIMLNKPRGYVTTMSDDLGRKCVASLVADVGCRVYPVGRLDKVSEGMLILTNDGAFANYMMHPSHEVPKYYHVRIEGIPTDEQLDKLSAPMEIDGFDIRPVAVAVLEKDDEHCTLQMELYEGRNRQIRKMCEQVGLKIIRLKRVAIGDIPLGSLRLGKWRYLTPEELTSLMPSRKEQFRFAAKDERAEQKAEETRKRKSHSPSHRQGRAGDSRGSRYGHAPKGMRKPKTGE
ncbi:MAG: pseudouridine synthase [Eubacteriales bacterium]